MSGFPKPIHFTEDGKLLHPGTSICLLAWFLNVLTAIGVNFCLAIKGDISTLPVAGTLGYPIPVVSFFGPIRAADGTLYQ